MPKKRTGKALLIKPGSLSTIASSSNSNPPNHESPPSVNDLIRESRRMQYRDQSVSSNPPVISSVPPEVRQALNLPPPEVPRPRPNGVRPTRPTPTPTFERGPSRNRTVPGPPPPRSWLTGSRHAPAALAEGRSQTLRILYGNVSLPGGFFPPLGSLQHYALKEMAINWEWHAQNTDAAYLATIPVRLKEALLSYIAMHHDDTYKCVNPLQRLFLSTDASPEDHREVRRLDLNRGLGVWTQLKGLEKDLTQQHIKKDTDDLALDEIPDSWDQDLPGLSSLSINDALTRTLAFPNLAHLSLGLNPLATTLPPSWKALLKLADHLPALLSLSLTHWPQPTYTPIAVKTRITVSAGTSGSFPTVVFGGTNMYSALDSDWREAAGILRSLSRKLPSLTWLDLSGCGAWWDALMWRQLGSSWNSGLFETSAADGRPEWNGAWRGVTTIILKIGWSPVAPVPDSDKSEPHMERDDFVFLGRKTAHMEDENEYKTLERRQRDVVVGLRAVRREVQGGWITFVT